MIDLAHIHPMLVHFPIVLFLAAVVLDIVMLARGGDLSEGVCLAAVALGALLVGSLFAIAAAIFGDIALDKATASGFPKAPLEVHQDLGLTTMWFFVILAALRAFAWWRHVSLKGGRGWVVGALGVIGVGILLAAAYHGGGLVYELGVNVVPVKP